MVYACGQGGRRHSCSAGGLCMQLPVGGVSLPVYACVWRMAQPALAAWQLMYAVAHGCCAILDLCMRSWVGHKRAAVYACGCWSSCESGALRHSGHMLSLLSCGVSPILHPCLCSPLCRQFFFKASIPMCYARCAHPCVAPTLVRFPSPGFVQCLRLLGLKVGLNVGRQWQVPASLLFGVLKYYM